MVSRDCLPGEQSDIELFSADPEKKPEFSLLIRTPSSKQVSGQRPTVSGDGLPSEWSCRVGKEDFENGRMHFDLQAPRRGGHEKQRSGADAVDWVGRVSHFSSFPVVCFVGSCPAD
jgi:hypothetical protein